MRDGTKTVAWRCEAEVETIRLLCSHRLIYYELLDVLLELLLWLSWAKLRLLSVVKLYFTCAGRYNGRPI